MDVYEILEATSVVLSLVFLLLLMRENRWCWPFGILGSAIGVYLFVSPGAEVKLYSEAILYSYYVWIGIYGWLRWNSDDSKAIPIIIWTKKQHMLAIGVGCVAFPILGFVMDNYFDSNSPYIDAATTVFSFIASYMQARKVFSSWHFWIVINAVSAVLYYNRGLELYPVLMVVYFGMSIIGLLQWKKQLA